MRVFGLCFVAALALGCGKQRVHEAAEAREAAPPAVAQSARRYEPSGLTRLPSSLAGSAQTIVATDEAPAAVASDDRFVYWVGDGGIQRAHRGSWPNAWAVDTLATGKFADLAVTRGHVYWTELDDTLATVWSYDKDTASIRALEGAPRDVSRLVARGSALALADPLFGIREIDDDGRLTTYNFSHWVASNAVLAMDDAHIFAFSGASFSSVDRAHPEAKETRYPSAFNPIDAVSDGTRFYWLEPGGAGDPDPRCEGCATPHPYGKLRALHISGGPVREILEDLPDVESVSLARGLLWVTTKRGLLRIDPNAPVPAAVRVRPDALTHGRAAPLGDGLVLAAKEPTRLVLLASP